MSWPRATAALVVAIVTSVALGVAVGVPHQRDQASIATGDGTYLADLPTARTEVIGAAWAGGIVVVGGLTRDGAASGLAHLWDPATDTWDPLPPLPEPLHHTTTAVLDGELWVVGGFTGAAGAWQSTDAVWRLSSPEAASWEPGPALPGPRGAPATAVVDGRLVVVGGVDGDGRTVASSVVLEDDRWRAGPVLPAPAEHLAATPAPDGTAGVIVVGGRDGGIATSMTSAVLLDLDASSTVPLPDVAVARSGFGAVTVGGRACVVGGELPSGTIAAVECLTDDGWQVVAEDPNARHGLAVVALDGAVHVIGGGLRPGLNVSAVHWRLDP